MRRIELLFWLIVGISLNLLRKMSWKKYKMKRKKNQNLKESKACSWNGSVNFALL